MLVGWATEFSEDRLRQRVSRRGWRRRAAEKNCRRAWTEEQRNIEMRRGKKKWPRVGAEWFRCSARAGGLVELNQYLPSGRTASRQTGTLSGTPRRTGQDGWDKEAKEWEWSCQHLEEHGRIAKREGSRKVHDQTTWIRRGTGAALCPRAGGGAGEARCS